MRALVLYAASALTVLVTAGVIAWMNGILGPMVQDGFLYPLGYVGRANGGSIPWLVLAKLAVLGGLTVWLIRRPFPYLWLAWSAAGALISGRFFGHYAIQALPPLAIVATLGLRAWWSRGVIRGAPPDADGKAARRALTVLPAVFVLLASACALGGWVMAAGGHDSILARRLQWYANFTRLAMGAESYSVYRDQVDDHVTRNIRIAQALDSLPPGPALVWGNIPWVYVLSHRLPATAYTSAYRDPPVPGETVALRRAVMHHRPEIAVVVFPPLPPLGPAAASLSRGYWPVKQIRDATIYVARAPPGR